MEINNILITGSIYEDIEAIIEQESYLNDKNFRFLAEEKVTEQDLFWADAFVSFRATDPFSFANIKWVHSLGAGVDGFLSAQEWKQDVPLTRTICSFGEKISEYCLSYILRDLQAHDRFNELKANKEWRKVSPKPLKDIKVVVYGTGVIGQKIANVFSSLGVKVNGVSLSGKQKDYFNEVVQVEAANRQFLDGVDYVINTLPLTKHTNNLFNKTFFARLSNTIFINVGRGGSVENTALYRALEEGSLRLAVLDVFEEEPLPESDPLWSHPNVLITPHISAITTAEEAVECFIDTLKKLETGEELINLVDTSKGF